MIIRINSAGVKTVWDEKNDCPICTFKGGVYETDDSKIIAELEKRGLIEKGEKVTVEEAGGNDKKRTATRNKKAAD